MLGLVLVVSILVGLMRGGRLSHLGEMSVRGWHCYLAAGMFQLIFYAAPASSSLLGALYPLSLVALAAGVIVDRRVPGMIWVETGLLLNGAVVLLNGGRMPVGLKAGMFQTRGIQALSHAPLSQASRLSFLADIIRLPLPEGHGLLLSAGDLFIVLGAFVAIQHLMLSGQERP